MDERPQTGGRKEQPGGSWHPCLCHFQDGEEDKQADGPSTGVDGQDGAGHEQDLGSLGPRTEILSS